MSRLTLTYTLGLALLALGITACGDEGEPPAADAAGPEASPGICQMTSCQGQQLPVVPCPAGTVAEFSCTRNQTGRCEWANARCTTVMDAGAESPAADGPGADTEADAPGADAGVPEDAPAAG